MGLGILEARVDIEHIPGTVILAEREAHSENITGNLKHGKGRYSHIVLSPQPSNDPNDPLNWPMVKKLGVVAIVTFGSSLIAGTIGPLLNASLAVLAVQFGKSIGQIAEVSGYQLLVVACTGPFVSAVARKYGKRPVFLFASFVPLIGTIIGSATSGFNGLLAARVVQGFGAAAYESLVFSVVGDIFYVHERGLYTTIMSFTLMCSSNLSPVIAGPVTASLGWPYLFHILVAVIGFQFILVLLFVPETTYNRTNQLVKLNGTADLSKTGDVEAFDPSQKERFVQAEQLVIVSSQLGDVPPKKTFVQSMAIYTGKYSNENWLSLIAGPFIACFNLGACWSIVMSGAITSFYVAASYTPAQIFSPPPYFLNAAGVGYLSVGPFLGGTLGSALLAVLLDPLAIALTRRNHGVFEPEFRLPLGLFGFVGGAGLMAFGAVAQQQGSMYLVCFCWGLALFGIAFIIGSSAAYAIDAYRDMSNEIFVANIMFKNFLFYGYTYFVNDWVASSGPVQVFYVLGGVLMGLVATTPVMYIFGKKYRAYWHRNNLFEKLGVQSYAE